MWNWLIIIGDFVHNPIMAGYGNNFECLDCLKKLLSPKIQNWILHCHATLVGKTVFLSLGKLTKLVQIKGITFHLLAICMYCWCITKARTKELSISILSARVCTKCKQTCLSEAVFSALIKCVWPNIWWLLITNTAFPYQFICRMILWRTWKQ